MRKNIFLHLISFILASGLAVILISLVPNTLAEPQEISIAGSPQKQSGFYPNLKAGNQAEVDYLGSLKTPSQLTIFGSSEFSGSEYCPFNFLPNTYGIPALGIGHAHHQHFSILGELMAGREQLEGSKVTIIISPGWFNTSGTNSSAFLEFFRPNFLKKIALDTQISEEYKWALGKYIHKNYSEFDGVSYEMDVLREDYLSQNGILPQKGLSKLRSTIRNKFAARYHVDQVEYNVELSSENLRSNDLDLGQLADSLRTSFVSNITNNDLFVYDDYFQKYLLRTDGTVKTGKFKSINLSNNQEFEDFKLLVKFIAEQGVDASFIILPLNPYYYPELEKGNELISALTTEMNEHSIPYLNLWAETTSEYEPGILKDVMHVGDYGWLRINQFLIDNYYE